MVSRLRPLDVTVDFDDRTYKLGDTIDLRVALTARGDVGVREGRVDLECEVRYIEHSTVMMPAYRRTASGPGTPVSTASIPQVRKQITKEHKETYVHSSVSFMTDAQLPAGTRQYRAGLEVQLEPPAHADQGTVKWTLVTTIDVARARDVKRRRRVKVAIE